MAMRERKVEKAERRQSERATKLADRSAALRRQNLDLQRLQKQVDGRLAELEAKSEALAQAEARRSEASARLQRETHALVKSRKELAEKQSALAEQERELGVGVGRKTEALEKRARADVEKVAERRRQLDEREARLDERERELAKRRTRLAARSRAEREAERQGAEAIWHLRYESVLARSHARRLLRIERRLERERSEVESKIVALETTRAHVGSAAAGVEARAAELELGERRLVRAQAVVAAGAADVERVRAELQEIYGARHDLASWLLHELATLLAQARDQGLGAGLLQSIGRAEGTARELQRAMREAANATAQINFSNEAVTRLMRGPLKRPSQVARGLASGPRSSGRPSSPNP
jgi:chromosome segregation ATPase